MEFQTEISGHIGQFWVNPANIGVIDKRWFLAVDLFAFVVHSNEVAASVQVSNRMARDEWVYAVREQIDGKAKELSTRFNQE